MGSESLLSVQRNQLEVKPAASAISALNNKWPKHLRTPDELAQALRFKTQKLQLIKSPLPSKLVLQFIGSWAYLLAHKLNKSYVKNNQVFENEIRRIEEQNARPPVARLANGQHQAKKSDSKRSSPLITLSNHISCIDDPVLWATLLPLKYYYTQTESVRWVGAATDICFAKAWHSSFFSLGKTFPIIREAGLQQPAMDFALALLQHNQWLHLFPEGRVMRNDQQQIISNHQHGYIFKWGIAKLILDYFRSYGNGERADSEIRILPLYHLGLDKVLPIGRPYIPKFGLSISVFIRPEVIIMNARTLTEILRNQTVTSLAYSMTTENTTSTKMLSKSLSNDEICQVKLTNYLELEMEKIREPAEQFHAISVNKPKNLMGQFS